MTTPNHTIRSIDALISSTPEAQPIDPANSPVRQQEVRPDARAEAPQVEAPEAESAPEHEVKTPIPPKNVENTPETPENEENKSSSNDADGLDEYGNALPKPKMYTEEEVQRMIRDRLKRGASARQEPEQPTQQQVQQAQNDGFEFDENSGETWTQQLERFVENTVAKIGQKQQQRAAQEHQKRAQAEFEGKFHDGMSKYPDFVETLQDKTVTNEMMMGIRGLKNPAAFLYAAAKRMPGELERISKIPDTYQQVAEMGILHEKLTKTRRASGAPTPVTQDRGDVNDKTPARVSIDHLIHEDGARRYKR